MKPRNLIIAAIVLAALSVGVWWANKHPQSAEPKSSASASTKLADIPESDVQELTIRKKDGSSVSVQRSGGKWVVTAPQQLPADQDAISSMVSSLSPLT